MIFGWRDGRTGDVANVVLERLGGPAEQVMWRAEIYVEGPEGHALRGALVERELDALARGLAAAAGDALARTLPSPGAALAAALA